MTATVDEPLVIDQPGVYDIPAERYHADPVVGGSLSSSGARRLLPPSCPALYQHWLNGRPPYKPEFEFGHAAHRLVLGAGPDIVVIDAEDWRTKAARAQRDEALAAGQVPLLPHEHEVVVAMAAKLREHPVAAALFHPDRGQPEQSLFWADPATGVRCRARLDWMPYFTAYAADGQPTPGSGHPGRLIVPDYKTCRSAAPDDIQRAVHDHGYHQQAAWYVDGIKAVYPMWRNPLATDPAFVFVFQEKTAPYLVTVVQLDKLAMQVGRYLNRKAIDTYAQCQQTGRWPGYSDDVEIIPLPRWVENEYKDEEIW